MDINIADGGSIEGKIEANGKLEYGLIMMPTAFGYNLFINKYPY